MVHWAWVLIAFAGGAAAMLGGMALAVLSDLGPHHRPRGRKP